MRVEFVSRLAGVASERPGARRGGLREGVLQGRSHLIIGVSTYSALALRSAFGLTLTPLGVEPAAWALPLSAVVVAVGSLLPDVDQRQAMLSRQMPVRPVSEVVSRVVHHRGPTHSLLALLLASFLAGGAEATFHLPGLAALVAWGYLLHLLADMLTHSGVPLLWPLGGRYGLLPIRFATDTVFERLAVAGIVLASAAHVLWPYLGPALSAAS